MDRIRDLWCSLSRAAGEKSLARVTASSRDRLDRDPIGDGRTLMTVRADDRYSDASDIVRRRKGFDFETRNERPLRSTEMETETETQVKR